MQQTPPVLPTGDGTTDHWARNGEVDLHYLEVRARAPGSAVLIVPGFGEEAADYADLLQAVAPRRAIAVDLRGRGRSAMPASGYRLEDHAGDIAAIASAACILRPHLVTYSRGTPYGLAWAFAAHGGVRSITIGDYPPAQLVPPADLAKMVATRVWRNRLMTDRMPLAAVTAMVDDAVTIEFWSELGEAGVPVLVIRGDRRGMVDDSVEARFRVEVPGVRVVTFHGSGHDLWSPDPDRFASTVASFLHDIETEPAGAVTGPPTGRPGS